MKHVTLLSSWLLLVILFSCGQDDPKSVKDFTLEDYLIETGFEEEVEAVIDNIPYEFGLRFKPRLDGHITKVLVKLPDDQTDLRITIWDAETQEDLRTETIASVTADVEFSHNITPLELEKGHEYMITFNTNDWYNHSRTDGASVEYPITVGTVFITGYGYATGITQTYPSVFPLDYYAGDLSFVFE